MTDTTRTDYRSLYDKDYIGAWDLTDKDLTVSITKVKGGELTGLGGRKSKKPVIYMSHTEKGLAINATNGKTIASMYGNYVQDWVGKRITLYKSMTRNPNGEGDVECIRVRPRAPDVRGALISPADAQMLTSEFESCDPTALATFLKIAKIDRLDRLPADDLNEAKEWISRRRSRAQAAA